ncbi:MAG: amidohydrolase family protein, partial [Bacilli bacterium]|nr:amidohydrolase family protein [Bacilli bacterium]
YQIPAIYLGEERVKKTYPLKDYLDNGALLVSHSDFPVSPTFSATDAFCIGVYGCVPSSEKDGFNRNDGQNISRMDALKALTINVAYSWHEENNMGSIAIGKLANFAVLDKDLLKDDFVEIEKAKVLATFVDGEQVYKG